MPVNFEYFVPKNGHRVFTAKIKLGNGDLVTPTSVTWQYATSLTNYSRAWLMAPDGVDVYVSGTGLVGEEDILVCKATYLYLGSTFRFTEHIGITVGPEIPLLPDPDRPESLTFVAGEPY